MEIAILVSRQKVRATASNALRAHFALHQSVQSLPVGVGREGAARDGIVQAVRLVEEDQLIVGFPFMIILPRHAHLAMQRFEPHALVGKLDRERTVQRLLRAITAARFPWQEDEEEQRDIRPKADAPEGTLVEKPARGPAVDG